MNSKDIQLRRDSPAPSHADTTTTRRQEVWYSVTWTIELTADSPRAAAQQAQAIQRDTNSIATVFDVRCLEDLRTVRIDLADPDDQGAEQCTE